MLLVKCTGYGVRGTLLLAEMSRRPVLLIALIFLEFHNIKYPSGPDQYAVPVCVVPAYVVV